MDVDLFQEFLWLIPRLKRSRNAFKPMMGDYMKKTNFPVTKGGKQGLLVGFRPGSKKTALELEKFLPTRQQTWPVVLDHFPQS
jgi:hypothetical protein